MMNQLKILCSIAILSLTLLLVAGCGSSEKTAAPAAPATQPAAGHEGHSGQMPKEDPMPMMKDMEQQMQDLMKQVKGGQMMDAQKTAGLLVSTTDKVMPHMMDNTLKEGIHKAANDIKDVVNSGKADPAALEGKMKVMQDMMKQTTTHLQTMKH